MNEEEFIKKTRENFTGKSILGRPVNPDALAYTLLGENEYKKDNYEGAIEWYSKSINIDSANHYNFTQRGKSYMFLKVYDKALTDLFLSQKLDDNFPNNQAIAECYLFKQEHNVAIKYFNIALDKMTDSEKALDWLGEIDFGTMKARIFNNMAICYYHLKNHVAVLDATTKGIGENRNYPNNYAVRGAMYLELGKHKEAKSDLLTAADMGDKQSAFLLDKFFSSDGDNGTRSQDMELEFLFISLDHKRFEMGKHVSGPFGGAKRGVQVQANITGNEGYTVTIFNLDGPQPTIQMAPKQMKLIKRDKEKIVLKGYGFDAFGASFEDYGITIYHRDGEIERIIGHMFDRGIDIEYLR